MAFQIVQTNQGRPSLTLDGYHYRKDKELKNGNISWRCASTTTRCKSRLHTDSDLQVIVVLPNDHIHLPDQRAIDRRMLRTTAKRKATEDITIRPNKLLRKELVKMHDENSLKPEDLKSTAKAVYRERMKFYGKLPVSRSEVHMLLKERELKTSKGEPFVCVNNEEEEIIIFSCLTNLMTLCNVHELFMDGTFQYCPKFFMQMYTIHGFQNGHYVPLVFMLLPGRSKEIYTKAFNFLLSILNSHCLEFSPESIHVDFEQAVINTLENLCPTSIIKCCKFHLGQSWWRKIQELGLSNDFKSGSENGKWLKSFFGLSCLEPSDVEDSFVEDIMSIAPTDTKSVQFADYVTTNYISSDSKFPPNLWAESTIRNS
ncbi:uncharacterized protein [Palaemon carinicauda]|uniref:uncharacterized protein n=1 Tax=Palaemon carinicauda TaxID=392227 RepID=UPI0035B6663A